MPNDPININEGLASPDDSGVMTESGDVKSLQVPTNVDDSRLRREFESLLVAAERLQESCDRLHGRLELSNVVGAVLLSVLGLVSVYVGQVANWTFGAAGIVVTFVIFGAFQRFTQVSTKRRLERDRRALDSLAQLLRETETAFLMQGVMGTLETAQFKIRMARFDIRSQ